MTLTNSVAVVTGGGAGIGRAVAFRLGRAGACIAICGRNEKRLQETSGALAGEGIDVFAAGCDVTSREQVDRFMDQVVERFGQVNILVNNAGVSGINPVQEGGYSKWHEVIATNLHGVYYFAVRALQNMPDGGRIINLSSVLGKFGVPGYTAYCTSKHGIIGFTRALALEVAPRKINVNAVCPGWVETDMAHLGMEESARLNHLTYEEFRRKALARVPLKKMLQPEEVAELIYFLVSPAAANVTGQAINICGGQTMH